MLDNSLLSDLNHQINLEYYSANLYLQMSAWCEHNGYTGAAKFLSKHAHEETQHMFKLFTYVNETGGMAKIGRIDAPPHEFKSLHEVFVKTYEHEQLITLAINALVDQALTTKDYSTFNFLQWYVAEQHEEEKLFKSILDKFEIAGSTDKYLFFIDKEIGRIEAI